MDTTFLETEAKSIRRQTLDLCSKIGEGRLASSFSAIDLFVALYFHVLHFRPEGALWDGAQSWVMANPSREWPGRDRFVLSKGHALAGLYPVLAATGWIPPDYANKVCVPGSPYGPYGDFVPGVDAAWGSVGHGLGVATGMALADRMDMKPRLTVVMLGDGECYEGATWEAAMLAAHHRLTNLVAIVDRNYGMTIDFTENAVRLEPLADKWRAFGWEVRVINGHDFSEILPAFDGARNGSLGKPLCIIANTIKGKGLSQLEYNPLGHVVIPQGHDLDRARDELEA